MRAQLPPQIPLETLPDTPHLTGKLLALEAGLFEPPAVASPVAAGDELTLLEVNTPVDEAREALRWIKACMVRRGLSPSACAVAVPDFNTYRAPLEAAGRECGIRLCFSQGQQLASTPEAAALLDLLALQRDDFPRRALLDTIRSPFFNLSAFGFKPGDGKSLEIASRWGQVIEDIECWQKTLQRLLKITRAEDGRKLQMEDEKMKPLTVATSMKRRPV